LLEQLEKLLRDKKTRMENKDDFRPSAVMIPLVYENGHWSILFEVRALGLQWQPGEICFPGGRIETSDASPEAAALRETVEELGVQQDDIEILGALDFIVSPIGVMVYPFVGVIHKPENIAVNAGEVAEFFTVPLAYLVKNPPIVGHMESGTRPSSDFPLHLLPDTYKKDWNRRFKYPLHFYTYEDKVIWGLTGRILFSFVEIYKELLSNDCSAQ
jgi:8-oxo-dGTP pyrophosphatase MutT (NUDIX family)